MQELDLALVRTILREKPELRSIRDRQDRNLLQLACSIAPEKRSSDRAQVRCADFLLGQEFDIDEPVGKDACTALFFAVARARNPSLVRLLLKRGARVATAPGGGLFAAAWYGDLENLGILLDAGANIEKVAGVTPFVAAWGWKQFEAAKYLVKRGANVNFQDRKGRTALHLGLEREFDPKLLRWLVQHGATVEIEDKEGVSPRVKARRKRDQRWAAVLR